jgi:hypothetical protein
LGFKPRVALAVLCLVTLALAALPGASAAPFSEGPLVQVSGASPIPATCIGDTNASSTSVNNYGTEVEPYVAVDPSIPRTPESSSVPGSRTVGTTAGRGGS